MAFAIKDCSAKDTRGFSRNYAVILERSDRISQSVVWATTYEILSLRCRSFQNDTSKSLAGVLARANIVFSVEIASAVSHRWRVGWRVTTPMLSSWSVSDRISWAEVWAVATRLLRR